MSTDQNCFAYNMSYIKQMNHGSIGPKLTRCEIHNETLHCDFDDYVMMLTTTRTLDIPSGGVFSIKTRTCLMWASRASSRIIVTSQVEWTGRSFIKGACVLTDSSPLFSPTYPRCVKKTGIIEKSAIEGQRTYQWELDCAMRLFIQEHKTKFIPPSLDPASVVVAVKGEGVVPTTPTGPVPQNEAAVRKKCEKECEQERD